MITGVYRTFVLAKDHIAARDFWIDKMGFEVHLETDECPGPRWIELKAPDGQVLIFQPLPEGAPSPEGQMSHVSFKCDDLQKTYKQLLDRGVEFVSPPSQQHWGLSATFKDHEGSLFVLGEDSANYAWQNGDGDGSSQ